MRAKLCARIEYRDGEWRGSGVGGTGDHIQGSSALHPPHCPQAVVAGGGPSLSVSREHCPRFRKPVHLFVHSLIQASVGGVPVVWNAPCWEPGTESDGQHNLACPSGACWVASGRASEQVSTWVDHDRRGEMPPEGSPGAPEEKRPVETYCMTSNTGQLGRGHLSGKRRNVLSGLSEYQSGLYRAARCPRGPAGCQVGS